MEDRILQCRHIMLFYFKKKKKDKTASKMYDKLCFEYKINAVSVRVCQR